MYRPKCSNRCVYVTEPTWWGWACLSQRDDHPATVSTWRWTTLLSVGDRLIEMVHIHRSATWWWTIQLELCVCVYRPGEVTSAQVGLWWRGSVVRCCRESVHRQLDCWRSAHWSGTAAASNKANSTFYHVKHLIMFIQKKDDRKSSDNLMKASPVWAPEHKLPTTGSFPRRKKSSQRSNEFY